MLVGRAAERLVIRDLLAGARVGDSAVLVLTGEPGIGKTALLTEAGTVVGEMRVLRAAGVASEQAVPFGGLLQLLRPVLALLDQIPESQSRALSSALLLEPGGAAEPSRFAVGAATLSLLCRAAEDRPLAVLVDDAHLLDSSSVEALVFAARRVVSDAVAMFFAVRAGAPGASPWEVLSSLTLSGLDLDDAEELVTRVSGTRVQHGHLVRLHDATAGNPLALLELGERADELEALPPDVSMAVSDRLTRSFIGRAEDLGASTRAVLVVAAADSRSVATVLQACTVLGFPDPNLAEAEDAGLISVSGDRIEFRHPLVRSAIYGAADPETRREVHRALAGVVPSTETDRLAWHLSESAVAPDEATATTLEQVGVQASARGAYTIAASAHERAADLSPTSSRLSARLAAAGEAAWLAGLSERAVPLLDRALAGEGEPRLRAHVLEVRGAVETRGGSLDSALRILMAAAEEMRTSEPDIAVRLYADAIHVCFYLADPSGAMRAAAKIDALLDSTTDPRSSYLGGMASGMALILNGAGESGIDRLRAAASRLTTTEEGVSDRFRLPLRLLSTLWLRDSGTQHELVHSAISELRQQAALGSLPYLLMHIGRDCATSDRWVDAESAYVEGIKLAGETGQSTDLGVSLAGLAQVYARQGRAEECRTHADLAADLCLRNQIRLGTIWAEFARGDLATGLGDTRGAVSHFEGLEALLARTGMADPDQSCAPELAEAYLQLGRAEEARRTSERFGANADAKGQPWSLARARRTAALCDAGAPGEARFREALELHEETPDGYERARTELAFGSRLRRERRRVDARPVLRSALTTFEELGALPWADRAAGELAATGETVRRRETSAVDELTPQERQIARLLSQGRTTRETAAALFISPKTVEYHLRHVYLKLGVRSRGALSEIIGR